jgi:dTDP-glucose 4,6-dehydratase
MTKTLLVTGGAGFIGSNFIQKWLSEHPGDRVVNLDALTYAGNRNTLRDLEGREDYRFVHGDIRDQELLGRLFKEEPFDTVVHFAAESHVDRSILGPSAFVETNVRGTFALLEATRAAWDPAPPHARFLHVSTDEVYGTLSPEDPPWTEESPYEPSSPYSATKAASDHLVRAYTHTFGLPALITHCTNNYGPYQFPEKLIPLMTLNALMGKALPIYGDGLQVRDWLHVEDHCAAITAVIERGRIGETYDVASGEGHTNLEIVHRILDHVDQLRPDAAPRAHLITHVTDRLGHDRRYAIDPVKLTEELGWSPQHEFEQGIDATVAWYLEHEAWWASILDGSYRP